MIFYFSESEKHLLSSFYLPAIFSDMTKIWLFRPLHLTLPQQGLTIAVWALIGQDYWTSIQRNTQIAKLLNLYPKKFSNLKTIDPLSKGILKSQDYWTSLQRNTQILTSYIVLVDKWKCFIYINHHLSRLMTKTAKWSVRPLKTQMPSLIRVFAVRTKKGWVLSYPYSVRRKLRSDGADAQADRWAHRSFCWFWVVGSGDGAG